MKKTYKPYYEKLKDPRWQKRRLEVMERAGFKCEWCSDESETLNVHHWFYDKGKEPWEYDTGHLACLCESCHEKAESLRRDILLQFAILPSESQQQAMEEVCGYIQGVHIAVDPDGCHHIEPRGYEIYGALMSWGALGGLSDYVNYDALNGVIVTSEEDEQNLMIYPEGMAAIRNKLEEIKCDSHLPIGILSDCYKTHWEQEGFFQRTGVRWFKAFRELVSTAEPGCSTSVGWWL